MTFKEFLDAINKSTSNHEQLYDLFSKAKDSESFQINKSFAEDFISKIDESKITDFGDKLVNFISICNSESQNAKKYGGDEFLSKADKLRVITTQLISIYDDVTKKQLDKDDKHSNASRNITLGEQGDILRITETISDLKLKVNKVAESADNKITSLLANNISILGIFVAIAFAGFGVMSIFPKIDTAYAMTSINGFIRTTFFLLLVALLIYNLLLLLVYFIFKLTRAFSSSESVQASFLDSIKLTLFFWIDGILLFLVLVSCAGSLFVCI